VAGVILVAGAANPGKSNEKLVENPCQTAVWPIIPAHCFGGERAVAFPASTEAHESPGLRGLGPEVTSAKADLLQLPTSVERYRTIEKRIDGVSELRRVERTTLE